MTQKTHDIVATTGSYVDNTGQQKSRFENAGGVFRDSNGGTFILMKRTFNPAGVPFREGSDSIILSVFPVRPAGQTGQQPQQQRPAAPAPASLPNVDDDIPFILNATLYETTSPLQRRMARAGVAMKNRHE